MLRFQCTGAHYTTIHAGAKTDVIFISRQRFYVTPIFSPFFSVLDISTFKAREGEMESNLLLPFFFFLLRVLFICSTLLCFPPSFSARMRTQWQSDSMCLFSFFFFFEEFSCLSLRVHYIRSQTLPNNRTPPFFFVIILLHVLTYVSICVGYACFFFFSWTWVLLKIMKERRRKKKPQLYYKQFSPFLYA